MEEEIQAIIDELQKMLMAEILAAQAQMARNFKKLMDELPKNCSFCKVKDNKFYEHEGSYICISCKDEVELFSMLAL